VYKGQVTVTAGTRSGRGQSAVLIPVPEAESIVGRWRHEYDPVAAAGGPAHITLVVPWLPPDEISEDEVNRLEKELEKLTHDVIAEINRVLVEGGISVYRLHVHQASLESWFLQVTSRLGEGQ